MFDLDFETMPAIGINVMISGFTTQIVKNINNKSVLEFTIEENLGNKEPNDFLLEVRHDPKNKYLANKTNSINQTMRSTTAIMSGLLYFEKPIIDDNTNDETTPGIHILHLDDISLISSRNNNSTQHDLNLPWMNQTESNYSNRIHRAPRGSTPRSKRARTTTSTSRITRSQSLTSALEENPPPNSLETSSEDQNNDTS